MVEVRLRRGRLLRNLNQAALLVVVAATAALLLRPSDDEGLLGLPELGVGDRAPRTIKAPRDFAIADPVTTERLRSDAAAEVLPVFDLVTGVGVDAKSRLERAYAEMAPERPPLAPSSPPIGPSWPQDRALADNFMRALQLYFDDRELEALFRGGFGEDVRDAAIMVVRSVHEQRIAEDKDVLRLQAPDGLTLRVLAANGDVEREERVRDLRTIIGADAARASIDELVAKKLEHLAPHARREVALLAKRLLKANVLANAAETQARSRRARESVRPVYIPIKRGEAVIRGGELVGERQRMLLQGMARELEGESRFQLPAGAALLAVLLSVLLYRLHKDRRRRLLPQHRDLGFTASVFVVTLLLAWVAYYGAALLSELLPFAGAETWRLLVPAAFGPLLLRFVVGREVAAAFAPLSAILIGMGMDHGLYASVFALAGGITAAGIREPSQRPRRQLFLGGLAAGVAQAAALAALAMLESRLLSMTTLLELSVALTSGLLSALFVLLVLPAVDALFGYTSPFKLHELANLNHPLLRELLVQAPGTYHHSIVVGALAEAGAAVAGGDPLLARVGGYYHDIGKLKNPRLYSENTPRRGSDEGTPRQRPSILSAGEASEIRLHVTEGLEIAGQHRLGQPILEIIAQHHGTGVVGGALQEDEPSSPTTNPQVGVHYAGPPPQSIEAALVMLADRVEAAAESLFEGGRFEDLAVERLIQKVVQDAIAGGELGASHVTLHDLSQVESAFLVVLRELLSRRGRSASTGANLSELPQPVLLPPSRDEYRPN